MHPDTATANKLLQQALASAAVESFGLAHQMPFLEFRDGGSEDHTLSIDTEVESNIVFEEALGLTQEEKLLLLFNRVNLRLVTHIECDDLANLVIDFDNGVQLRFAGSPKEETSEPWQLGSKANFETGGYLLIATYAGGYAMWDYTTKAV
ncbi:hypothetical protein [Hymenobacter fodinae]|nr:hypothetical protein [Hymenobacter fodinae]